MNAKVKKWITFLASPILLHYCLPIMMIYLIVGTVSQKYIGLYQATQLFFSDIIIWLGGVPLPGFPIVMAVMFVNLMAKIIFKSPCNWRQSGVIISHLAVAFLFLGGLVTASFSQEGFVDLSINQKKNSVSDYHVREFVIRDQDGNRAYSAPHETLKNAQEITIDGLPFTLTIFESCQNCKIDMRGETSGDNIYQGMAAKMRLSPDTLKKQDEENMSGLTFSVSDMTDAPAQIFTVLEDVPRWPQITAMGKTYKFSVEKQQRFLPFVIELLDLKKTVHPGTQLASEYESRIRISDEYGQWESVISMNQPLRYRGYTLFQSSFIRSPTGDMSVLAVVKNMGRSFPYIAGIVLALGLLVHLIIRRI